MAFTGIALLNVAATSVRIQTDAPAYDQTVSTGATDIVKLDLAGGAASVLTITITNSAGLAKVGEIVIGTVFTVGTLRPKPSGGIKSYSTKTQDPYGNWEIVKRGFSEKLSPLVGVLNTRVDLVRDTLAEYIDTPAVFVGSTEYSVLILYGFLNDFSFVLADSVLRSTFSMEIESLASKGST